MKKKSVKNMIIESIVDGGKEITYTDMIKLALNHSRGHEVEYNYKKHRGFWSTNFNGFNGHMRAGGEGYVYKNAETGKWFAKWYDKNEKLEYMIKKSVDSIVTFAWYTGRLNAIEQLNGRSYAAYYSINQRRDSVKKCEKKIESIFKKYS